MTDKVYYEDAGKGSHRRKEDKKSFESGFDAINWSVKVAPVIGEGVEPMSQEKIDEFNAVLDEYEE